VPPPPERVPNLPEPDRTVAELLGRLMSFWGFRRNLGRVWGVLYLSPEPLGSAELVDRLGLSTGAVSMALSELQDWKVVRRRQVAGVRRDLYEAEDELWEMISRVLRDREWRELDTAIEALERAHSELAGSDPKDAGQVLRRRRIDELHQLLTSVQDGIALLLATEGPDELFALHEPD
jgi:DNA-binding transcriptional regulator GbsR (MarR family)